jgi:hypothetical protein
VKVVVGVVGGVVVVVSEAEVEVEVEVRKRRRAVGGGCRQSLEIEGRRGEEGWVCDGPSSSLFRST